MGAGHISDRREYIGVVKCSFNPDEAKEWECYSMKEAGMGVFGKWRYFPAVDDVVMSGCETSYSTENVMNFDFTSGKRAVCYIYHAYDKGGKDRLFCSAFGENYPIYQR